MTDRSFFSKEAGCSLRYSVGQPMGLRSSFAAMALTHHLVLRVCAAMTDKSSAECIHGNNSITQIAGSPKYAILGDDIVINGSATAAVYQDLMTRVLGMKISMNKSIIAVGAFEFARRLIRHGCEYSPLPAQLVLQIRNYPRLVVLFSRMLKER